MFLIPWEDAKKFSGACFLASLSFDPILPESTWIRERKLYKWWGMQSYHRYSQVGHVLYKLANGNILDWSKSIKRQIMTVEGHKNVCRVLYGNYNEALVEVSFFCKAREMFESSSLSQPITLSCLLKVDTVAFKLNIKNLQCLVWLCLQYYTPDMHVQPNYPFFLIENIPFGINIENGVMDSLCQMDILVFLMATVQCTASRIKCTDYPNEETRIVHSFLFPVCLKQQLCTDDQAKWWSAAYQFFTNSFNFKQTSLRCTLVFGLETVRLVGIHGMSLQLLVHIAKSLNEKLKDLQKCTTIRQSTASELKPLENRVTSFWNHARFVIEKIQRENKYELPPTRLFQEPRDTEFTLDSFNHLKSEVIFAMSLIAMNKSEYSRAVDGFRQINTPESKLNMAKTLRFWAEKEITNKENYEEGLVKREDMLLEGRNILYNLLDEINIDSSDKDFKEAVISELNETEQIIHANQEDDKSECSYYSCSSTSHQPEARGNRVHSARRNPNSVFKTHSNIGREQNMHVQPGDDEDSQSAVILRSQRSQRHYQHQDALSRDLANGGDTGLNHDMVLKVYDSLIENTKQMAEQVCESSRLLRIVVEQNIESSTIFRELLQENKSILHELKAEVSDLKSKFSSPQLPYASSQNQSQMFESLDEVDSNQQGANINLGQPRGLSTNGPHVVTLDYPQPLQINPLWQYHNTNQIQQGYSHPYPNPYTSATNIHGQPPYLTNPNTPCQIRTENSIGQAEMLTPEYGTKLGFGINLTPSHVATNPNPTGQASGPIQNKTLLNTSTCFPAGNQSQVTLGQGIFSTQHAETAFTDHIATPAVTQSLATSFKGLISQQENFSNGVLLVTQPSKHGQSAVSTGGATLNNTNLRSIDGATLNNTNLRSTGGAIPNNTNLRSTDEATLNNTNLRSTDGAIPNNTNLRSTDGAIPNNTNLRSTDGAIPNNTNLRSTDGAIPNNTNLRSTDAAILNNTNLSPTGGATLNNTNLSSTGGAILNNTNLNPTVNQSQTSIFSFGAQPASDQKHISTPQIGTAMPTNTRKDAVQTQATTFKFSTEPGGFSAPCTDRVAPPANTSTSTTANQPSAFYFGSGNISNSRQVDTSTTKVTSLTQAPCFTFGAGITSRQTATSTNGAKLDNAIFGTNVTPSKATSSNISAGATSGQEQTATQNKNEPLNMSSTGTAKTPTTNFNFGVGFNTGQSQHAVTPSSVSNTITQSPASSVTPGVVPGTAQHTNINNTNVSSALTHQQSSIFQFGAAKAADKGLNTTKPTSTNVADAASQQKPGVETSKIGTSSTAATTQSMSPQSNSQSTSSNAAAKANKTVLKPASFDINVSPPAQGPTGDLRDTKPVHLVAAATDTVQRENLVPATANNIPTVVSPKNIATQEINQKQNNSLSTEQKQKASPDTEQKQKLSPSSEKIQKSSPNTEQKQKVNPSSEQKQKASPNTEQNVQSSAESTADGAETPQIGPSPVMNKGISTTTDAKFQSPQVDSQNMKVTGHQGNSKRSDGNSLDERKKQIPIDGVKNVSPVIPVSSLSSKKQQEDDHATGVKLNTESGELDEGGETFKEREAKNRKESMQVGQIISNKAAPDSVRLLSVHTSDEDDMSDEHEISSQETGQGSLQFGHRVLFRAKPDSEVYLKPYKNETHADSTDTDSDQTDSDEPQPDTDSVSQVSEDKTITEMTDENDRKIVNQDDESGTLSNEDRIIVHPVVTVKSIISNESLTTRNTQSTLQHQSRHDEHNAEVYDEEQNGHPSFYHDTRVKHVPGHISAQHTDTMTSINRTSSELDDDISSETSSTQWSEEASQNSFYVGQRLSSIAMPNSESNLLSCASEEDQSSDKMERSSQDSGENVQHVGQRLLFQAKSDSEVYLKHNNNINHPDSTDTETDQTDSDETPSEDTDTTIEGMTDEKGCNIVNPDDETDQVSNKDRIIIHPINSTVSNETLTTRNTHLSLQYQSRQAENNTDGYDEEQNGHPASHYDTRPKYVPGHISSQDTDTVTHVNIRNSGMNEDPNTETSSEHWSEESSDKSFCIGQRLSSQAMPNSENNLLSCASDEDKKVMERSSQETGQGSLQSGQRFLFQAKPDSEVYLKPYNENHADSTDSDQTDSDEPQPDTDSKDNMSQVSEDTTITEMTDENDRNIVNQDDESDKLPNKDRVIVHPVNSTVSNEVLTTRNTQSTLQHQSRQDEHSADGYDSEQDRCPPICHDTKPKLEPKRIFLQQSDSTPLTKTSSSETSSDTLTDDSEQESLQVGRKLVFQNQSGSGGPSSPHLEQNSLSPVDFWPAQDKQDVNTMDYDSVSSTDSTMTGLSEENNHRKFYTGEETETMAIGDRIIFYSKDYIRPVTLGHSRLPNHGETQNTRQLYQGLERAPVSELPNHRETLNTRELYQVSERAPVHENVSVECTCTIDPSNRSSCFDNISETSSDLLSEESGSESIPIGQIFSSQPMQDSERKLLSYSSGDDLSTVKINDRLSENRREEILRGDKKILMERFESERSCSVGLEQSERGRHLPSYRDQEESRSIYHRSECETADVAFNNLGWTKQNSQTSLCNTGEQDESRSADDEIESSSEDDKRGQTKHKQDKRNQKQSWRNSNNNNYEQKGSSFVDGGCSSKRDGHELKEHRNDKQNGNSTDEDENKQKSYSANKDNKEQTEHSNNEHVQEQESPSVDGEENEEKEQISKTNENEQTSDSAKKDENKQIKHSNEDGEHEQKEHHTGENKSEQKSHSAEDDDNEHTNYSNEEDKNEKISHSTKDENGQKEHSAEEEENGQNKHSAEEDEIEQKEHNTENENVQKEHSTKDKNGQKERSTEDKNGQKKHSAEVDENGQKKHSADENENGQKEHSAEDKNEQKENSAEEDENGQKEHSAEDENEQKEHSAEEDENGQKEHSAEEDENGQKEQSAEEDENVQKEHSTEEDENEQKEHSKEENAQKEHSNEEDKNGQKEHSAEVDENGQKKHSAEEDENGQKEHSAEVDENGQKEHSAEEDENGQKEHSAEEDENGQKEQIADENENGQKEHSAEDENEQKEHSAEEDENGQKEHRNEEDENGQKEYSTEEDENGQKKHRNEEDENGQKEHRNEDENGQKQHSAEVDENGLKEHSAEEDENQQKEHSAEQDENGQKEHSAEEDENGQKEHSAEKDENVLKEHSTEEDENGQKEHSTEEDENEQKEHSKEENAQKEHSNEEDENGQKEHSTEEDENGQKEHSTEEDKNGLKERINDEGENKQISHSHEEYENKLKTLIVQENENELKEQCIDKDKNAQISDSDEKDKNDQIVHSRPTTKSENELKAAKDYENVQKGNSTEDDKQKASTTEEHQADKKDSSYENNENKDTTDTTVSVHSFPKSEHTNKSESSYNVSHHENEKKPKNASLKESFGENQEKQPTEDAVNNDSICDTEKFSSSQQSHLDKEIIRNDETHEQSTVVTDQDKLSIEQNTRDQNSDEKQLGKSPINSHSQHATALKNSQSQQKKLSQNAHLKKKKESQNSSSKQGADLSQNNQSQQSMQDDQLQHQHDTLEHGACDFPGDENLPFKRQVTLSKNKEDFGKVALTLTKDGVNYELRFDGGKINTIRTIIKKGDITNLQTRGSTCSWETSFNDSEKEMKIHFSVCFNNPSPARIFYNLLQSYSTNQQ
ncbi:uncharacterized protein LOC131951228 [Physella acuta]|uniref:uncharacterized protein LOC131951228 n=1 Tax=Physella acuta TaxID=109671 RepID=UPI0027DB8BD0|nr:uncharacterized protein LOC131951228 [Physella acuta]